MIRRRLYRNLSLNFSLSRSTFGCPRSWRDDRPVLGVVSMGLSFGNKEDVLNITSCEFHVVGRGTNMKLNGIHQGWKCCSLKCPRKPQEISFLRRILRTLPGRAPNGLYASGYQRFPPTTPQVTVASSVHNLCTTTVFNVRAPKRIFELTYLLRNLNRNCRVINTEKACLRLSLSSFLPRNVPTFVVRRRTRHFETRRLGKKRDSGPSRVDSPAVARQPHLAFSRDHHHIDKSLESHVCHTSFAHGPFLAQKNNHGSSYTCLR